MIFNQFVGFFDSTWSMNKGIPIDLEHWVQIITTIPEISSTDHSCNQTTDKRIIPHLTVDHPFKIKGQII